MAVMGSKKRKGIACKGSENIEVAKPELVEKLRNDVMESVREKLKGMSDNGTSVGVDRF